MELLQSLKSKNSNKLQLHFVDLLLAILLTATFIYSVIEPLHLDFKRAKLFSGSLKGGIVLMWNQVAEYLGNSKYILLNNYEGAGKNYGFAMLFLVGAVFIVSYFAVKSKNKWLLYTYLILPVGLGIKAGIGANLWGVAFVIAVILALNYLFSIEVIETKELAIAALTVMMVFGLTLGSDRITESYYGDKIKKNSRTVGKDFEIFAEEAKYGSLHPKEEEVAFRIKMENPQQMWLKSKVGEVYSKEEWQNNPPYMQYKYLKEKEILGKSGYNPISQSSQILSVIGEKINKNKVNIEYEKASKKYFLYPYEYVGENPKDTKTYGDSYISRESIIPDGNIEFDVSGEQMSKWTETLGKLYKETGSDSYRKYRDLEYTTNKWAYARFLDIDSNIAANLKKEIGDPGDQEKEHVDYKYAVNKIMSYMEKNIVYSKASEKDNMKSNEFFKSFKGNRSLIATMATMMFRYYGIPSRYVEGYQITPEDVSKMKPGEYFTVRGDRWHCWTEIYVDGFGWVPLEVNPEFKNRMNQADLSIGIENSNLINTFKPHVNNKKFIVENEKILRKKSNKSYELWFYFLLIVLLIAVSAITYFTVNLVRRILKRNKLFKGNDLKLAITAIYKELQDKKLVLHSQVIGLGEEAAYSNHSFTESQRAFMLKAWKNRRRFKRKKA